MVELLFLLQMTDNAGSYPRSWWTTGGAGSPIPLLVDDRWGRQSYPAPGGRQLGPAVPERSLPGIEPASSSAPNGRSLSAVARANRAVCVTLAEQAGFLHTHRGLVRPPLVVCPLIESLRKNERVDRHEPQRLVPEFKVLCQPMT